MAQSVRRPKTLEAVDHTLPRENKRTSYFGNVKNRLGSKLPAGVSQGPEFAGGRLEPCPRERDAGEAAGDGGRPRPQPAAERPPGHSHRIRNPRLRQYYLQGTSLESNSPVQQEETSALTLDATTSEVQESGASVASNNMDLQALFQSLYCKYYKNDMCLKAPPGDTVFSITSQIGSASHGYAIKVNRDPSSASTLFPEMRLNVPMARSTSAARNSSAAEPQPRPRSELESPPLPASPPSPSPDTEYDKLLDVEAVPMPDGQLCLLTLPPECSQGDGPEAVPYLKLFCRYITDCKGVVSGVLLVTPNKTFFDPCKSHPLVTEHGCEEYLLSCSIDCLASVSFFSDITHIHFNSSQHRWKGKKSAKCPAALRGLQGPASHQKMEASWSVVSAGSSELQPAGASEDEGSDSRDMAETEEHLNRLSARATRAGPPAGALGVAVLSNAATFCCGAQRVASNVRMELLRSEETELTNQTAVPGKQPPCGAGGLMFVRLRAQRTAGPKKVFGIQQGTSRTLSRRDAWFALSQQSSDELRAYLSHWRPELTVVEGGAVEREAEGDDEEFVLIEDSAADEDQRDRLRRPRRSGDDWEMVSMEDSGNRPALVFDREPECLSEIVEESSILEASHVRELCAELPPRTIGHAWQLTFSTSRHGSSLRALYRKLSDTDSPVLIVIKDALHQVFGSFLSHPLRPSETFYGTGETFLFMLHPRFKCFRWTGENTFFIKGNLDSFAVGGGSGHFGLWLDETLYLGRSSPCYTFNNCCLSETDDFRVMELEVWTFS